MVESRCGILCSECDYREKMNCSGCVHIKNPFWGECEVKSCCEGKNIDNCSKCINFPCQTLKRFAYDKKQGDNGERIEQCKRWNAE